MVLKSLQLQGFKSFPDKTEIQFLGGLTAIVGPNGSGKSNISDAIRWVLGEQSSRSLRGAKMEDVIFGGTATRGPVGFAEVSLILDNGTQVFHSDFSEIMITRRYYRSGESEYYINKNHCRLRDIHELFMDTGLGRDGYSMIGQGRIDEILSLKSEDRREVFEEAAGITKFRYRKQEAERRLAATEENLVRIRDIYVELESQKKPLEKQAEKAKQYLELHGQLRVQEVSLWLHNLARIHTDADKNLTAQDICDTQIAQEKEARQTLYVKSEALTEKLHSMDAQIEQMRVQLREREKRIAEYDSRCAVLDASIYNHEENIKRVKSESARQAEQADVLEMQLTERRTHCDKLDAQNTQLSAQHTACAAQAEQLHEESRQLHEQLTARQAEQQNQTQARFALELARTAACTALENLGTRRDTIEQEIAYAAQQLAQETQTGQTLERELADCETTLAESKNKQSGVQLKENSRRKKVEMLETESRRLAAEYTDCENRAAMLREMQKEYEGFSRSVKTIMTRAEHGKISGVHGPVSTLLTVEDEFILAIETALGTAASNIVVDSPSVGRDAIAYLKRVDGGRATFLPLDTIRPSTLREKNLDSEPGFCGTADTLVHYQPIYQNVVSNLLGRTVVVDTLDAALTIAKAHGNRFRIVTKDGQLLREGGAMTGGSASKSTGVLVRAAKLRTLEEQLATLSEKCAQTDTRLEAAQHELAALDFDSKAIEAERTRAQEEKTRLTAVISQHTILLDSLQQRHDALVLERDDLAAARARYEQIAAQKKNELDTLDTALAGLMQSIEQNTEKLTAVQEKQQQNEEQMNRLTTALTENRTEAAAERRALADLERVRHDMTAALSDSANTVEGLQAEIARMREERSRAGDDKVQDEKTALRLHEQIASSTQQRLQVEGDKTAVDKQIQSQGETILELGRERARLEARGEQLKNQEAQLLDKMWESYQLTPTPAARIAQPIDNVTHTEKDIAGLKTQLRALGNVNLDAVQEYEKLRERYEFLGIQKADLEKAQTELYKVIEQLTQSMKEIFAREFQKLNVFFGQTFREIFDGGHAELRLEDTTDILGCGIDIRVSPPGKTLKTITLLSGGEKAFVAIALYFAILKVRPTPFCVLDEIEAALDDVNVMRFAQYIRRLSAQTQFIVITHRRGTMEQADMLYGITMQERGVSKMLMLNLAEAEKRLGIQIK